MMRSLYSGVAGLTSHQTRMDVIGNNIANVNTYGFKASRTTFSDIYYQTKKSATGGRAAFAGNNESAIGYGVEVSSIDKDMSTSSFQTTNRTLDLAISGDGFFMTAGVNEIGMIADVAYTRYGNFGVDSFGNLVNTQNKFVLGTENDGDFSTLIMNQKVPSDNPNELDIINVNTLVWDAFRNECKVNWEEVPDTVKFSSDGTTVNPNVKASKENDPDTGKPVLMDKDDNILYYVDGNYVNENGVEYDINTGNYLDEDGNEYVFEIQQDLTTGDPIYTYECITEGPYKEMVFTYNNVEKTYEYTDENNVTTYTQMTDGALKYSDLNGFTVGTDGVLTATYASEIKALARIELATFDNIEGLTQLGETTFGESTASGTPNIKVPGASGAGTVQSTKLEMSNVNLASEFSDMIITQRGFQANSRIITVSDSMLEELTNLKR